MHYVCSDIHGQYALYRRMLEQIDFKDEDILYVLGDAIDRGPENIRTLQDIMSRDNIIFFLGNHELAMHDYIHQTGYKNVWCHGRNGGRKTLSEFELLDIEEQRAVLTYINKTWIQKYVEIDGEKYALSHSSFIMDKIGEDVRFYEEPRYNAVFDAVWNSPYRFWEYASPDNYPEEYTHIIGHVPVQSEGLETPPLINGNIIDIDGGCALLPVGENGMLYCMSLEKDESGNREEFWVLPE